MPDCGAEWIHTGGQGAEPMTAEKTVSFLIALTVASDAPGVWSIRGGFSDGSTMRLATVGEGGDDPRNAETLMATAQALASALRFLHRRFEVAELGIEGRTAQVSIDYDPEADDPAVSYRAVVLRHGRRSERFGTGDPARDWRDMRARSREVAEILMHAPECGAFAADAGGWRMDPAEGLVRE